MDTNNDDVIDVLEAADYVLLWEEEYDLPADLAAAMSYYLLKLHHVYGAEISAGELRNLLTQL